MQKGETEKAIKFYHKAIETNQTNSTAQYNLGYLYEVAGDREKAMQHYENFVKINDPVFSKEVERIRKKLVQKYYMKK